MLFKKQHIINTKYSICDFSNTNSCKLKIILSIIIISIYTLNCNAQLLLRTTSTADFSAVSINSSFKNMNYADKWNLEEAFYYRNRFNKQSQEKSVYSIFSIYKKGTSVGFCPYGIDVDLMSERFNKNKANTFRYWNKIRMGFKFIIEKNLDDSVETLIGYIIPELYFSYLHIPQSARGDQTTKARKGSVMFFLMITPLKRSLTYVKFNVGSVWIKPYFRQEEITFNNMENFSGVTVEVEINKNGYNRNKVESSKDVYRGITLFGGPEYSLTNSRIFMNLGISINTENH